MPNKSRFPNTDADFSYFIGIIISYLNVAANKARLVFTPTATSNLTSLNSYYSTAATGWLSVFPLTQSQSTTSTPLVLAKNLLRSQMETAISAILDDIPKSILTLLDRTTFNMPEPTGTHTASIIPVSIPAITVGTHDHLKVTLTILDNKKSEVLSNVADADSIDLEGAFLANGVVAPAGFPAITDYHNIANTGKSTYIRNYTEDQVKGTEYIKARYLNTTGEPGSWSEVVVVNVI